MLDFIKTYWAQIIFFCTLLGGFLRFAYAMIEATKCSLRNDILSIYDRCKSEKKITKWQLGSIEKSFEIYRKLKGNSFVGDIVKRVQNFEIID